ncbi:hypothetical protein U27_02136 [Candidatus Vecturithrix granuli]|uniref:Uncharacterized protein n=1 Tax=Vecturithrix granuli TaxID=1499967 RepID=A0A0S6W6Q7_VECG1|nr:hypothetical protein U27_02136 [Candidatus Vecturithrix granuli]
MKKISLKQWISEAIFPKTRYSRIFLLLVIFKALSYWLMAMWYYPAQPLSVIALYRSGESMNYYPIMAALSSFEFGETVVVEHLGKGVQAFPFASIAFHAFAFRLFHVYGIILADIIIALLHYLIFCTFLRVIGIPKLLAECCSLLIVTQGIDRVLFQFTRLYNIFPRNIFFIVLLLFCILTIGMLIYLSCRKTIPPFRTSFLITTIFFTGLLLLSLGVIGYSHWNWRIPRPFVTDVYFFLCVCLVTTLLNSSEECNDTEGYGHALRSAQALLARPKQSFGTPKNVHNLVCQYKGDYQRKILRVIWACLGGSFAFLLQGEIYLTISTSLMIGGVMIHLLTRTHSTREQKIQCFKGFLLFSITAMIGAIPFLLQNLLTHPDLPRRLGLFPIQRTRIFVLPGWRPYFIIGLSCILGTLLIQLGKHQTLHNFSHYRRNIWFFICFCFAGWAALPLSGIILSKTIQPQHFLYRLEHIFSLTMLIFLLYAFIWQFTQFSNPFLLLKKRYIRFSQMLILCVILLSVTSTIRFAAVFAKNDIPVLGTHEPDSVSTSNYRTDFFNTTQELLKYKMGKLPVLATVDFQIYSWWVSFWKGYAFFPFAFTSPLPDSELEYRLAVFCKLLGMNIEDYQKFIHENYIQYFWQSHLKYQVSSAYSFSSLSDYPQYVQEKIKKTTILDNYDIALPLSEEKRLIELFNQITVPIETLNIELIVLTNGMFLQQFSPPDNHFELCYQNSTFRIWRRR